MSSCESFGKPKVRHTSKEAAYEHINSPFNSGIHKRQVYRCPHCRSWHIGRIPAPKRFKKRPIDEVLVGILIGALKQVINREENT